VLQLVRPSKPLAMAIAGPLPLHRVNWGSSAE
jgi:hypothetical protein